jgi:anti-sigma B factor antagonist
LRLSPRLSLELRRTDRDGVEKGATVASRGGGSFDVSVLAEANHACFLGLAGELDVASAPTLTAAVEALRSRDHLATLTLDLAELEFMDSTGLACLLRIEKECSEANQKLRVIGEQGQVRDLLLLTGAADALKRGGT